MGGVKNRELCLSRTARNSCSKITFNCLLPRLLSSWRLLIIWTSQGFIYNLEIIWWRDYVESHRVFKIHTRKGDNVDITFIPGAISQYMESASSVWLPQHVSRIHLWASSWVRKKKLGRTSKLNSILILKDQSPPGLAIDKQSILYPSCLWF